LPAHLSGKISGARRRRLARLLAELDDGDTEIVTRLDELVCSTRDLLNTLAAILQQRPPSVRCATPARIPPRCMGD
jgi:DNA invertase Pin-like site-specific DNA recombinase